ncbi:MAG: FAD:protein FMN transferase, partial [Bacteroidetes bacterium]|nr:FAD:protein FMN transferase [Bacteroidota bacterium]
GWPAEMLTSVTIICPDAELADALATAVFIMGADDGITFINQLKDIECFIIDENEKLYHSENISLNYYKPESD